MSSKSWTDPPDEEHVLVGRVRRPHGLRGMVVVESLTDNPQRWEVGNRLRAVAPSPDSPGAPPSGLPRELEVEQAQEHRGALLVQFRGVDGRDAAEALRGIGLAVPEADVPEAPEGTWYQFQLVGCRVWDAEAGDLGEVVDVVDSGGGDTLVVDDGRRQVLVPLVHDFLERVDVEAREIDLRLPPGLIETCASGS